MIVHARSAPEIASPSIAERVRKDVTTALQSIKTDGDEFIINDTVCYMKRGGRRQKITPCVMNKADYLSRTFQNTLRDKCNWKKEEEIRNQRIDNYVELATDDPVFQIAPDQFIDFFSDWLTSNSCTNIRREFLLQWYTYVQLGVLSLSNVPEEYSKYFTQSGGDKPRTIRIGLEFETGNIASSFRALSKLEMLLVLGELEFGVFVISIDKANAAARIWPQSNRNGSFQELDKRSYRNNQTIPLWEFGFQPDAFSSDAPYLEADGTLYTLEPTGRTHAEQGVDYRVFTRYGTEEILIPNPPSAASN